MANWPGIYNTGTATVAANGTTVTLQGAGAIASAVRPGDRFGAHRGLGIRITAVTAISLTLAQPWPGPAQTAAAYEISLTPYDSGYRQGVEDLLALIGGGNIPAFADLTLAANKGFHATGAGTMATHDLTAFMRGVLGAAAGPAALTALGAQGAGDYPTREMIGMGGLAAPVVTNADDAPLGSIRRFNGSDAAAVAANLPSLMGTGNRDWEIFTYGHPNRTVQIATETEAANGNPRGRTFQRIRTSTSWVAWTEIPFLVAAISNSNGYCERYSNGTQTCISNIITTGQTVASGSLFVTPQVSWVFPAAFGHPDPILKCGTVGNTTHWAMAFPNSATQGTAVAVSSSNTNSRPIRIEATGRWFA